MLATWVAAALVDNPRRAADARTRLVAVRSGGRGDAVEVGGLVEVFRVDANDVSRTAVDLSVVRTRRAGVIGAIWPGSRSGERRTHPPWPADVVIRRAAIPCDTRCSPANEGDGVPRQVRMPRPRPPGTEASALTALDRNRIEFGPPKLVVRVSEDDGLAVRRQLTRMSWAESNVNRFALPP